MSMVIAYLIRSIKKRQALIISTQINTVTDLVKYVFKKANSQLVDTIFFNGDA